jgi:hypothetical protein
MGLDPAGYWRWNWPQSRLKLSQFDPPLVTVPQRVLDPPISNST